MSDYDPSRDEDTKVISLPVTEKSVREISKPPGDTGVVVLPDGTKPVKMGSGEVTGILGEGGMAIVYEIWNEQLGVKRAVKLLRPNSTQENKDRFEKEMKVTAQLDHPNIIDIHYVGEWNGLPYIEMEMIDGISLSELIRRQGKLPLEVCTAIAIIVSRALDYTHHHEYKVSNQSYTGLLHRDLKPGNILFSREGIVRLTDFGVATPTDVAPSTSSGKVIGSMQYLAPEQLEEDDVDPRADIFSLGCILYEMFTGERTFPDRNITRLVRKRLKNEFRPLASFDLPIPAKLDRLVNECLHLNINKRPQDISDVLIELEKIHENLTLRSPEQVIAAYARGESFEEDTFLTQRKIPARLVAGIALITFSVVALGVYLFIRIPRSSDNGSLSGTVTADVKKVETKKKPQGQRIQQQVKKRDWPDLRRASQPERPEKTVTPNARKRIVHDKNVALTRKPRKSIYEKSSPKATTATSQTRKSAKDITVQGKRSDTKLDKMLRKYTTGDVITVLKAEDAVKNYTTVLDIYNALPRAKASSKEARLLKHRALVGMNKVNKSYFDNNHINDGEFYLSKAKFLFGSRQYQRAIWILGIIKTAPTVLINKRVLYKEVLYYSAKCQTAILENNPTPEKQKTAQQSWFKVKSEFRGNQSHSYFVEANNEIRRLSKINIE